MEAFQSLFCVKGELRASLKIEEVSLLAKGQQKKISIIPLGGLGEIGKNMTAFRYGEEIILVDAGLAFPDDEMLGIDLVIPNFPTLLKTRIRSRQSS